MGYHWCWKLERECLRTKEPTNEPKEWWRIVEMHIKYMCSKIMVCSLLIALKRFLQIRPNFQHINPNAVIYAFFLSCFVGHMFYGIFYTYHQFSEMFLVSVFFFLSGFFLFTSYADKNETWHSWKMNAQSLKKMELWIKMFENSKNFVNRKSMSLYFGFRCIYIFFWMKIMAYSSHQWWFKR